MPEDFQSAMAALADEEWGEFLGDEATYNSPLFSKGSYVLYHSRDGSWVPSKVIAIDQTVIPPSYCVEVNGSLRETEEWRLKPIVHSVPSRHILTTPRSDSGNLDFSSFGNFTTAIQPPGPTITVPVHPFKRKSTMGNLDAQSPKGSLRTRFTSPPASPKSPESAFRSFLSMAAPDVAHQLNEEDANQSRIARSGSLGRNPNNSLGFGSSICLAEHTESPRSLFDKPSSMNKRVSRSSSANSIADDDFGDFIAAEWSSDANQLVTTVSLDSSQFYPSGDDSPTDQPGTPSGQEAKLDEQRWWNSEEPLPIPEPLTPVVPMSPVGRKLWDSYLPSSPFRSIRRDGILSRSADLHDDVVQEYGIAWEEILREAAKFLEGGRKVLRNAARAAPEDVVLSEMLKMPRCQIYFAALGRIYCVATLVQHAADELGLLRLVPELRADWTRCWRAWSEPDVVGLHSGEVAGRPLSEVSLIAGLLAGIDLCQEVEAIEGAGDVLQNLNQDEFPRMLTWSPGLEGLTLVPLTALDIPASPTGFKNGSTSDGSLLPLVAWPDGKTSLSMVANFWRGAVSHVDPELE